MCGREGCSRDRAPGSRYCRSCRNEYMREWRRTHPPTEEERVHGVTRAYTNVLIRRGKMQRRPCQFCGEAKVQAHHPDYRDPRWVIWLCAPHHRELHASIRRLLAA